MSLGHMTGLYTAAQDRVRDLEAEVKALNDERMRLAESFSETINDANAENFVVIEVTNEAGVRLLITIQRKSGKSPSLIYREQSAKLVDLTHAAHAYRDLSVCHRLGKRPSEKLFAELEKAKEVLGE